MEEKNLNIKKEYIIDKKFICQLLYNNKIKSSKKPKNNLSVMPVKFNTKPKNEMTLNKNINKNTRKSYLTYQNNVSIQQNINTIPTTNNKKLISYI